MNNTNLVSAREDVFMAAEQTRVFKQPDPLRGDHSKRNQNKYYKFQKDIGHTTEECITLTDEIEKLICRGYLQDYMNDMKARPQNDKPKVEPPHEIRTIFGGPHFVEEKREAQDRYVQEMKDRPLTNVHSVDKWPAK